MKPKLILATGNRQLNDIYKLFISIIDEMKKYYVPDIIQTEKAIYTELYFLKKYLSPNHFAIGLFLDDKLIGFQLISVDSSVISLEWSGIDSNFRGHRYGSLLKKEVENYIKTNNLGHKMICDCLTINHESIKNLHRSGFKINSIVKNHWGHQDYFFWEKFID